MKSVKSITYSLDDINRLGYGVENNIIEKIDINIIAHFGNIPCLTIICADIIPYGNYNDIARLGFLLKGLVELLEVEREDGVFLSDLEDIPCRLVFEGNWKNHWGEKAVGIGHYRKDKFILFEDFNNLVG